MSEKYIEILEKNVKSIYTDHGITVINDRTSCIKYCIKNNRYDILKFLIEENERYNLDVVFMYTKYLLFENNIIDQIEKDFDLPNVHDKSKYIRNFFSESFSYKMEDDVYDVTKRAIVLYKKLNINNQKDIYIIYGDFLLSSITIKYYEPEDVLKSFDLLCETYSLSSNYMGKLVLKILDCSARNISYKLIKHMYERNYFIPNDSILNKSVIKKNKAVFEYLMSVHDFKYEKGSIIYHILRTNSSLFLRIFLDKGDYKYKDMDYKYIISHIKGNNKIGRIYDIIKESDIDIEKRVGINEGESIVDVLKQRIKYGHFGVVKIFSLEKMKRIKYEEEELEIIISKLFRDSLFDTFNEYLVMYNININNIQYLSNDYQMDKYRRYVRNKSLESVLSL